MSLDRIRLASLHDKVISAEQAAAFIKDGMTVGMSGFTRAGEAKAVPLALVKQAQANPLKITLITGASLGNDLDKQLTEAGVLARRMPFQVDNTLRKAINKGEVMFIDQHLSETVEQMRNLQLKKPDVAVIEAVAITEDGGIIPTTSVGNSASFAIFAKEVIVEINTNLSPAFEGLHDIYIPSYRPTRQPIPLTKVDERIGTAAINIDPAKIVGIVFNSELHDSPSTVTEPDDETQGIANHLIAFFEKEVAEGRLPKDLGPLQAGIGSIANAVLTGLKDSNFEDLVMYSEVLQDCTFELIDEWVSWDISGTVFHTGNWEIKQNTVICKVVPELIPSTIQERYPGQVLHFVWTNLEDDRQEIMKEEKVYKFLVCKKGLIQTDKIDCIYKKIKYR